jgi:hypothetical protein
LPGILEQIVQLGTWAGFCCHHLLGIFEQIIKLRMQVFVVIVSVKFLSRLLNSGFLHAFFCDSLPGILEQIAKLRMQAFIVIVYLEFFSRLINSRCRFLL